MSESKDDTPKLCDRCSVDTVSGGHRFPKGSACGWRRLCDACHDILRTAVQRLSAAALGNLSLDDIVLLGVRIGQGEAIYSRRFGVDGTKHAGHQIMVTVAEGELVRGRCEDCNEPLPWE